MGLLNFEDVLKAIKKEENKTILIGNGFSISLCNKFYYKNLFEASKNNFNISLEMKELFKKLETFDFEKVIAYLKISKEVISVYDKNLENKIEEELKVIKEVFVETFDAIHPKNQSVFKNEVKLKVRRFLSDFSKIFTTNYDLILYWMIMANETKVNIKASNDGFGKKDEELIWSASNRQNVYFLHGALHLFYTEKSDLTKISKDHENGSIMKQVSEKISNNEEPLLVLEGSHKEKLKKIKKNQYLNYSYDQLKEVDGVLVIFGFSLNKESDAHILDAIKENTHISCVYIGIHEEKDALIKIAESYFDKEKLKFFDSNSAVSWSYLI